MPGGRVALDDRKPALAAAGCGLAGAGRPGPAAVLVQVEPLEAAGVGVAEAGLLLDRHVAPGERERGGGLRAGERRDDAEVERLVRERQTERAGLLLAAAREPDAGGGVAVHEPLLARRRLAVPGEDQPFHGESVGALRRSASGT